MSLTHRLPDAVVHSEARRGNSASPVDLVIAALPAVAVLCFGMHVVLLLVTGTSMLAMVVPMLLLSGLCVAFTCRRGSGGSLRGYMVTAGFGIAMLLVHSSAGHRIHAGMDHAAMGHTDAGMTGSGNPATTGLVDGPMQAGLILAVLQVVVAMGAAVRLLRSSR